MCREDEAIRMMLEDRTLPDSFLDRVDREAKRYHKYVALQEEHDELNEVCGFFEHVKEVARKRSDLHCFCGFV